MTDSPCYSDKQQQTPELSFSMMCAGRLTSSSDTTPRGQQYSACQAYSSPATGCRQQWEQSQEQSGGNSTGEWVVLKRQGLGETALARLEAQREEEALRKQLRDGDEIPLRKPEELPGTKSWILVGSNDI